MGAAEIRAMSIPDTSDVGILYRSCSKVALGDPAKQSDYCAQLISAMYPAIFATRGIIAPIVQEQETRCDRRKYDIVRDVQQIPPTAEVLENFSHEKIARNYIALINSGTAAGEFPFLQSPADRAMAQSIVDWNKHTLKPNTPDAAEVLSQEMQRSLERGKTKNVRNLINSCENYLRTEDHDNLCNATISGVLIAYSLSKHHKLPHYTQEDACHQEKNDLLQEFTENRNACFPEAKNLKTRIAADLVRAGNAEIKTNPRTAASPAAYWAASKISHFYSCRK